MLKDMVIAHNFGCALWKLPLSNKKRKGNEEMTLYDLVNQMTIQGDIRVSVWGEEEEDVIEFENCDDLSSEDIHKVENLEVLYIFSASDNKLHIELEAVDGWGKVEEDEEYELLPVKVYLVSGAVRHFCTDFATEEEAEDYCEYYDYRMVDENGFEWSMEIEVDDED